MSDPTGAGQLLVGVKVQREGEQVLPQVTREVVQFQQTMQSVTGPASGATAMMFQLGAAQKKIADTAPQGVGGLRAVRGGIAALAFEATGVSGPMGKIATGLLMFGGGGEVVLGAVAGLGAVALAARALSQDFRDDTAAIDDEIKSVGALGAHGQLVAARLKLTQLQREREDASPGAVLKRGFSALVGPVFGGRSFDEQMQDVKRQEAAVKIAEAAATRGFLQPREQAAATANISERQAQLRLAMTLDQQGTFATTEAVRALVLEYGEHYPRALAKSIAATERQTAEINDQSDMFRGLIEVGGEADIRQDMLWSSTEKLTEAIRAQKLELRGWAPASAAAVAASERWAQHQVGLANLLRTEVPRAFEAIGAAAIQGFDNVTQAIVGSFVNIVQQLPGISPLGGGLIGLFGNVLSGLLGGGSKGVTIDKYSSAALDQLKGIPSGPSRMELAIVSSSTGELIDRVIFELGQRQLSDGVKRALPGLIWAGT